MIEAYAFLAAFTVQILVMSVLLPAWFTRNIRVQAARYPAERLAQLYPGADVGHARERFLAQYRALTTGIAVLAFLLLVWLFSDVWRADWNPGKAEALITLYFLAAFMLPVLLFARFVARFNKEHKPAERKRTAILQRRGLFDFVSPLTVFVAVLSYFLYATFVIYIEQHPFPGFAGALINIGVMTLLYALNAFAVYISLYGKKGNPFETHAGRLHTIGLAVKGFVYSCIVMVVYLSLNHSLRLLDLRSWEPFALSIFFALCALLASMGFAAPLRKPEADGLGSNIVR
jgi:magnesium-transporting ATPase (P-type)